MSHSSLYLKRYLPLVTVTLLVGIVSGVAGTLLALLLKAIQHLAYGYQPFELVSNESFLEGVQNASPFRRLLILIICGVISGVGWWLLYRFGKPLVNIVNTINSNARMPIISTLIHALLQIITVALGSPLGRETAPRETGAVFSQWIAIKASLNTNQIQIMAACGAGAGFAAVYNIPLGAALFVLEVLLCTISWTAILAAFATSTIGALISWVGIGNVSQYHFIDYNLQPSIYIWSFIFGPIIGVCAYWFIKIATLARQNAARGLWLPILCLINFTFIGLLAMYFPALLGNGKSPAQLEFSDSLGIGISFILLILRLLITWTSLRAGGCGGLLTPSLANGALLGVVIGGIWSYALPGSSLNVFALIGATAFLAAAQKMPITALIVMMEFTHAKIELLMPLLIAVIMATAAARFCSKLSKTL